MQVTLSRNFWRWFAQQCVKKAQAMVRPAVHLWKMLRCSRQLQCSGPAMAPRAQMQQWESFPLYIPKPVWEKMVEEHVTSLGALEVLLRELYRLGLRHPSETSQALLVAILVKREVNSFKQQSMQESQALFSLYGNVKGQWQGLVCPPVRKWACS